MSETTYDLALTHEELRALAFGGVLGDTTLAVQRKARKALAEAQRKGLHLPHTRYESCTGEFHLLDANGKVISQPLGEELSRFLVCAQDMAEMLLLVAEEAIDEGLIGSIRELLKKARYIP